MLVIVLHVIYSSDISPVWLVVSAGLFRGIRCLSRSIMTNAQARTAYSRWGITYYVLCTSRKPVSSNSSKYMCIIRTTLVALAAVCSRTAGFKSFAVYTPRSFSTFVSLSVLRLQQSRRPFHSWCFMSGQYAWLYTCPRCCSCQFCDHSPSLSRSFCKDLPSSTVFTCAHPDLGVVSKHFDWWQCREDRWQTTVAASHDWFLRHTTFNLGPRELHPFNDHSVPTRPTE